MLVGMIKTDSGISGSPAAWQVMSNQHNESMVFIVALTIICYHFAAAGAVISTVRINILPVSQLRISVLLYAMPFQLEQAALKPEQDNLTFIFASTEQKTIAPWSYENSLGEIIIGSRLMIKSNSEPHAYQNKSVYYVLYLISETCKFMFHINLFLFYINACL